jgi:hypothetical protein
MFMSRSMERRIQAQQGGRLYLILVFNEYGMVVTREIVQGLTNALSTMLSSMKMWINRGATHWELTKEISRIY